MFRKGSGFDSQRNYFFLFQFDSTSILKVLRPSDRKLWKDTFIMFQSKPQIALTPKRGETEAKVRQLVEGEKRDSALTASRQCVARLFLVLRRPCTMKLPSKVYGHRYREKRDRGRRGKEYLRAHSGTTPGVVYPGARVVKLCPETIMYLRFWSLVYRQQNQGTASIPLCWAQHCLYTLYRLFPSSTV